MPSYCAVADCASNNNKKGETEIQFHCFPKDPESANRWVRCCRRVDRMDPKSSRMCSKHFTPDDYERDLKNELLGLPPKKKLKKQAVPSIFGPPSPNHATKIQRKERLEKRNRKCLVEELLMADDEDPLPMEMEDTASTKECSTQTEGSHLKDNAEKTVLAIELLETAETISKLRKNNQQLNSRITAKNVIIKNLKSQLRSRSTPLDNNNTTKRPRAWSKAQIIKAISLRAVSLKGYETVRKRWKLLIPGPRTLRAHTQNFRCMPGILSEVLKAMKAKIKKMGKRSRFCGICFDEMSLDARCVYDKFNDQVIQGSKVQVLMVRGLCSNWKQPIYYDYDKSMTADLLKTIIKQLEEIGLMVMHTTCDFGADNRALLKALSIDEDNFSFPNPADPRRQVYVFADVPHLLKLIRNHLIDDGLITEDGTIIDLDVLEKMVVFNGTEKRLCPNLTPKSLQLTKAERMRVRPAAQLLSHRVSKLAEVVYPESPGISKFFEVINDGFDVLNSRVPVDKSQPLKSAFGMQLDEQLRRLSDLESQMSSIRFFTKGGKKLEKHPKKALLPCQKGFLMSIRSFRALREDLKTNYSIHYLLGTKTNQDILESFFSLVRAFGGSNSTPSALEFRYRMKLLILGSKPRSPKGTNCESEASDGNYICADILRQIHPAKSFTSVKPVTIKVPSSFANVNIQAFDVDEESLRYLAGYLAWKLKRNGKGVFGLPTDHAPRPQGTATWIHLVSHGGLLVPNDEIVSAVRNAESVFLEVMKSHFNSEKIAYMCEEAILAHYPESNPVIVKEFVQCRLKIRIKEVNSARRSTINFKKAKQFNLSKK